MRRPILARQAGGIERRSLSPSSVDPAAPFLLRRPAQRGIGLADDGRGLGELRRGRASRLRRATSRTRTRSNWRSSLLGSIGRRRPRRLAQISSSSARRQPSNGRASAHVGAGQRCECGASRQARARPTPRASRISKVSAWSSAWWRGDQHVDARAPRPIRRAPGSARRAARSWIAGLGLLVPRRRSGSRAERRAVLHRAATISASSRLPSRRP